MGPVLALYLILVLAGVPVLIWRSSRGQGLLGIPRLVLYRSAMTTSWGMALMGAAVLWWDQSLSPGEVGLKMIGLGSFLGWSTATLAGLAAAAGLFALIRRLTGRAESASLRHLIPRTRAERKLYILVAATAGITEEFVFRGLAITALSKIPLLSFPGGQWWAAGLVSASFGLGHGYQEALGMARAGLLGLGLAVPFLLTGSLLPGMAAHGLLDLSLLLQDFLETRRRRQGEIAASPPAGTVESP
ncbi:MAG: CPBP family intramembrane glutamic endopeptidase [Acidobacteriota bacterium]